MMHLFKIAFVATAFVIVGGRPNEYSSPDHDHLPAVDDSELSAAGDIAANLNEGQRTLRQAAPAIPEETEGDDDSAAAASGAGDCRPGFRRWPADGGCYPALRQGPCPPGHVLSAAADTHLQPCRPNPCPADGTLEWHGTEGVGCFPLHAPDSGCESEKMLYLDATSQTLVCNAPTMRGIFDPPRTRCPVGQRLDFRGRCRDILHQKFREQRT